MLLDVDKTLQDFRKNLTSYGLDDDVNIMIFSDHGMTNITKFVNITDTIDYSDIKVMFSTVTFVYIWPEKGKLDKVGIHLHKVSYQLYKYAYNGIKFPVLLLSSIYMYL